MKVFVYFGKSMFCIDFFTKSTFSIQVYIQLEVISVDNSGVTGGKQRGGLASYNHC